MSNPPASSGYAQSVSGFSVTFSMSSTMFTSERGYVLSRGTLRDKLDMSNYAFANRLNLKTRKTLMFEDTDVKE